MAAKMRYTMVIAIISASNSCPMRFIQAGKAPAEKERQNSDHLALYGLPLGTACFVVAYLLG